MLHKTRAGGQLLALESRLGPGALRRRADRIAFRKQSEVERWSLRTHEANSRRAWVDAFFSLYDTYAAYRRNDQTMLSKRLTNFRRRRVNEVKAMSKGKTTKPKSWLGGAVTRMLGSMKRGS